MNDETRTSPLDSPLFKPKPKTPTHTQEGYKPAVPVDEMLQYRILVITGLPGSGKTAIASAIAKELRCVHINADQVRNTINSRLGFTKVDRLTQAETLGNLARWVADSGQPVVVDFVCPDFDTREAFCHNTGDHRRNLTWIELERPGIVSRFEDTRRMYEPLHSSPNRDLLHLKKFVHLKNEEQPISVFVNRIINVLQAPK